MLQGQDEIRSIANSYLNQFPELFDVPYDPVKFNFQHSDAERTRDSFNAFVDEIFGTNAHTQISAEPTRATQALLKVNEFHIYNCYDLYFIENTEVSQKKCSLSLSSPTKHVLHL